MATRGYDVEGPWDNRYNDDGTYNLGMDFQAHFKAEQEALDKLLAVSNKATEDNPKGFILSFGVADGSALYQVEKLRPLTLRHIPFGDGYQIPDAHLRGLNLDDVKQQIRWRDAWKKPVGASA